MGLVKSLYVLFVLSLSLGLCCGELPESFSLNDDATNDFVEDSAAPVASEIQEVRKDPEPVLDSSFTEETVPQFPVSPLVEPALASGRDLLRLFSIQRK